jgi:hypothetical protein
MVPHDRRGGKTADPQPLPSDFAPFAEGSGTPSGKRFRSGYQRSKWRLQRLFAQLDDIKLENARLRLDISDLEAMFSEMKALNEPQQIVQAAAQGPSTSRRSHQPPSGMFILPAIRKCEPHRQERSPIPLTAERRKTNEGRREHPRNIGTIYVDRADGDNMANPRLLMARIGEDADKVVQAFWKEWPSGDFVVAPLFFHGLPPRRHLCTARSVSAALQTIELEPDR